jgi:tetratricopeptide (TPR) repeat protein
MQTGMPLRRRDRYDRREVLETAAREAARGRRRRAVALYRRVLFVEPANLDVHRQLAPLLAESGEAFEAWLSYRAVGRAHERAREYSKARQVYREAATRLPEKLDAWLSVARLERRLGDRRAARAALLEGRRHQRGRTKRATAMFLLREALDLDPWDPALVLDLANLLARSGRKPEADLWLEGLAARSKGVPLRRVRSAQLRLSPSLGRAWLWLRAA